LIDQFSIGESHLELLRLPYPVVAFEALWDSGAEPEDLRTDNIEVLPATHVAISPCAIRGHFSPNASNALSKNFSGRLFWSS
jgi:hypothetical protein